MKKNIKILFYLTLLLFSYQLQAQNDSRLRIGFRVGEGISTMLGNRYIGNARAINSYSLGNYLEKTGKLFGARFEMSIDKKGCYASTIERNIDLWYFSIKGLPHIYHHKIKAFTYLGLYYSYRVSRNYDHISPNNNGYYRYDYTRKEWGLSGGYRKIILDTQMLQLQADVRIEYTGIRSTPLYGPLKNGVLLGGINISFK